MTDGSGVRTGGETLIGERLELPDRFPRLIWLKGWGTGGLRIVLYECYRVSGDKLHW